MALVEPYEDPWPQKRPGLMRPVSSIDVTEPAVRFMIGYRKAFGNVAVDCPWCPDSEAGYTAGKAAKQRMYDEIAAKYDVCFHQVRLAADPRPPRAGEEG